MTARAVGVAERREPGPGERAERAKRRRLTWTIVAMGVAGVPVGYIMGREDRGLGLLTGTMSPVLAVAITLVFLLVILLGSALMWRNMDEHGKVQHLWVNAYASAALVIVYPTWFFLWKGRLLPEPHHLALFLIFYAGGLIGTLIRRFQLSR